MYSMTGYGKSVNNRFLDLNSKYPRIFVSLDDAIRKTVQSKLSRGRVDLFVSYSDKRERDIELNVDVALAKSYYESALKLSKEIEGLENDLTASVLLRMPDVISQENTVINEDVQEIVIKLVSEACDNLNAMREVEGEKLKEEILSHLSVIEGIVGEIEVHAPQIQIDHRNKLKERIEEYLADTKMDEARLLNEVAFFADKSNIDEEIARLKSHISQFKKICQSNQVGRKLDFLVQEFNREANTICSKANDVTLTSKGLELKCEIEKIREQIQNLE